MPKEILRIKKVKILFVYFLMLLNYVAIGIKSANANCDSTTITINAPNLQVYDNAAQAKALTGWLESPLLTTQCQHNSAKKWLKEAWLTNNLTDSGLTYEGARVYNTSIPGIGLIAEIAGTHGSPPSKDAQPFTPLHSGRVTLSNTTATQVTYYDYVRIKLIQTGAVNVIYNPKGTEVSVINLSVSDEGGASPITIRQVFLKWGELTTSTCNPFNIKIGRITPVPIREVIKKGTVIHGSLLFENGQQLSCKTHGKLTASFVNSHLIDTGKTIRLDGFDQKIYQLPGNSDIGITVAIKLGHAPRTDFNAVNHSFELSPPTCCDQVLTYIYFEVHYIALRDLNFGPYSIPQTQIANLVIKDQQQKEIAHFREAIMLTSDTLVIRPPACCLHINGSDSRRTFTLPTTLLTHLSGIKMGESLPAPYNLSFNLAFTCPGRGLDASTAALPLQYRFSDITQPGSSNNYIRNILESNSNSAEGVGFQLRQNNQPVILNKTYLYSDFVTNPKQSGPYNIPMELRYMRLAERIRPGKVKGLVVISFSNH